MNNKIASKLGKIILGKGLNAHVVMDDASTNGIFIILSGWADLAVIQHELNRHRKAWRKWRKIYELSAELGQAGLCEDMRLGRVRIIGEEGVHLKHLQIDPERAREIVTQIAIEMLVQFGITDHIRLLPSQSEPYYEVPEGLMDLDELCDFGFDDEWGTCDECGGLIRTSPDSYGWQPEYHDFEDGDRICGRCITKNWAEDYLEEHINRNKLVNTWLVDPEKYGWVDLNLDMETGMHRGQNDDPRAIIKLAKENRFEVIFSGSVGQFDVNWTSWAKEGEAEQVKAIITGANTRLPYDIAREMERALKGEKSEYVKVTTYTSKDFEDPEIAQKFIDGTLFKEEK